MDKNKIHGFMDQLNPFFIGAVNSMNEFEKEEHTEDIWYS